MILPTKHISIGTSLLGVGAHVLSMLDKPLTVTGLWEKMNVIADGGSYWRFVLVLDFLFVIGAIDIVEGLLVKAEG